MEPSTNKNLLTVEISSGILTLMVGIASMASPRTIPVASAIIPASISLGSGLARRELEKNDINSKLDQLLQKTKETSETRIKESTLSTADIVDPIEDLNKKIITLIEDIDEKVNTISGIKEKSAKNFINDSAENVIDASINKFSDNLEILTPEIVLLQDKASIHEKISSVLHEAKEHIIIVCPWVREHIIENQIIPCLKKALSRGVNIDIGWGHKNDFHYNDFQNNNQYNGLYLLRNLENQNCKGKLSLKCIGTNENYAICDRKFMLFTSNDFLASNQDDCPKDIDSGFYIKDQKLVHEFIERFNSIPEHTKICDAILKEVLQEKNQQISSQGPIGLEDKHYKDHTKQPQMYTDQASIGRSLLDR